MKIVSIGGGPGGLYAAILLKKSDPSREITVLERNGPSDTFGWGVVFSDETLGGFREADPESYRTITDDFAHWDDIDTRFRGRVIRSGGHGFAGISRRRLLEILQDRARELGVQLEFHREVEGPGEFPDADLILAADGINSKVRTKLADHFRPRLQPGAQKFIWLGTTLPLEAFTFIIRENEHGLFCVHAYRFDDEHSTFIVETDEDSFAAAGLGGMSTEDGVAYLERLFAEDLEGHRLLTNKSEWINFRHVTNESWHHENIVLIGDAAHTAHFSIGSGTKLAMEDSIHLAAAVDAAGTVPAALAAYEEGRRLDVAKLQRTALHSQKWFEDIRRHARHDAETFTFSMLSRSKRITHDNLQLRDPAYVASVDRHFASLAGVEDAGPPPSFCPLSLRGLELPNRLVVSPMCQYSAEDGVVNDWHLVHLGSRAVGGAGLVMTEMTDVSPEGRITPGCAGLWNEEQRDAWARIVDFVHGSSASRIGIQLAHAGRKGSCTRPWEGDRPLTEGGWETLAPSPIPFDEGWPAPREMSRADMDAVREAFLRSTRLAEEAGFDLLQLHWAHGYLFNAFVSPLSNHRTDEYGGSIENRLRFPLEVLDAVRAAWPGDKPLSVRLSCSDWLPGGFSEEDLLATARALKEHGCDVLDCSAGGVTPDAHPEIYGRMFQLPFSDLVRNEVGLPTMTVGNITSRDQADTILAAQRADLVVMAREHLRDPYLALHAAAQTGFEGVSWPVQYLAARPRHQD